MWSALVWSCGAGPRHLGLAAARARPAPGLRPLRALPRETVPRSRSRATRRRRRRGAPARGRARRRAVRATTTSRPSRHGCARRSGSSACEVRKRFASIADPSQITLVIVVDEGPVNIVMTGDPDRLRDRQRKRPAEDLWSCRSAAMRTATASPTARAHDARPHWMGSRSRIIVSGDVGRDQAGRRRSREAARRGLINRVTTGAPISQRTNPAVHQDDDRGAVCARGEHEFTRPLRLGGPPAGSRRRSTVSRIVSGRSGRRCRSTPASIRSGAKRRSTPRLMGHSISVKGARHRRRPGDYSGRRDAHGADGRGYLGTRRPDGARRPHPTRGLGSRRCPPTCSRSSAG